LNIKSHLLKYENTDLDLIDENISLISLLTEEPDFIYKIHNCGIFASLANLCKKDQRKDIINNCLRCFLNVANNADHECLIVYTYNNNII